MYKFALAEKNLLAILFFQEGVWGNLAFSKKAGFPQILCFASLHLRQAVGQGFGVGEEGLDCGVS